MLLKCYLTHINIIILRHFLYLIYLWPSLDLSLLMSYLCDLFFIFIFIFIMINRMNANTLVILLIFQNMSYYFLDHYVMRNVNNFQIAKVQSQGFLSICLTFCQFFSLSLLIKVQLIKKARNTRKCTKHFIPGFLCNLLLVLWRKKCVFDHFSQTYEVAKFSMIKLYIDMSDVIPENEHAKHANCGLHVNVWNFLFMAFCFMIKKDH